MGAMKKDLASIKSLPALPATVLKLIRALNGEGIDASEIEKIVRGDEAIALEVLSIANSAAGGGAPGRVFTLQESVARLGTRRLQKIALQHKCGKLLEDGGRGYGMRRGELWRGSIAGGVVAELIARKTNACDPGVAFVAALLRDIGKLAMDHLGQPDQIERTICSADASRGQLELEREEFGVDHTQIGAELARMWNLPERIVAAIRWHHAPPAQDGRDALIDIVHVADAVRSWMGIGLGNDGLNYPLDESALARMELDPAEIEPLMAQAQSAVAIIEGETVA